MRFFNFYTKYLLTILALVGTLNLSLTAQTRRTSAVKNKAVKPAETLSSETFPAMNEAWNKGELPAVLPIPGGNADEAIALLAAKISAKTSESVPALLTALQMSGFFITGRDGRTILAPPDGKGQGLPVNGWEVASVAKLLGDGKQTTLADLEKSLRFIPKLKNAPIARSVINGLQINVNNSQNPFLRNWARLIVELGKNSPQKNDLSALSASEAAPLDALQNFLILRRIYGDFFALGEKIKVKTQKTSIETRQKNINFVNAKYSPNELSETEKFAFYKAENSAAIFTPVMTKAVEAPCQMSGDAPLILDAVATGLGYGFGALTGYLDGALGSEMLGKYTEVVGIANIILAYAKFMQTYASLETKITLEDSPPLVRTKNSKPGERKNLKAEVKMNVGNWQMYNCLRTAINLVGIDFAVASDGAVSGAGVQWHLDEGGAGDVYSNDGGLTGKEQIVGFTQDGPQIQQPGTSTGTGGTSTGTGGTRVGNATYTKTDDNGIARIILEGSPQKNAKVYKVTPVMKQAKVSTTVKLKAGDLKSDSVDVTGQVLGGIPGLITMPLELLYRLDWISTAFLTVPVKDWEECTGDAWTGTITYQRTQQASNNKTTERVSKRGQDISSFQMTSNYTAQVTVSQSPDRQDQSVGKANISSSTTATEKTSSTEMNLCSGKRALQQMSGQTSSTSQETGSAGNQNAVVGISVNSDGTYRISIKTSDIKGMASGSQSSSYSGQCVPKEGKNITSQPTETTITGKSFGTQELQRINPNEPNRLSGSYSQTNYDVTETITWDLRKCGSSQATNRQTESNFGRENYSGKIEMLKPEDALSDAEN